MQQVRELLTSSQAGHILNLSARTIQRMADAGEIPLVQKLPGRNGARLFSRVDIERIAAARSEQAAS